MESWSITPSLRWCSIVTLIMIGLASPHVVGCRDTDTFEGLSRPLKMPNLEGVNWDGMYFNLEELRGKVVFLMFGYTNCPGPCPLSLSKIRQLREAIHAEDQVATVFITVDPTHDDARKIGSYIKSFATRSNGADVIGWFGVRPASEFTSDPWGPLVSENYRPELHSAAVYLLDRQGRLRGTLRGSETVSSVIPYIEQLLAEK